MKTTHAKKVDGFDNIIETEVCWWVDRNGDVHLEVPDGFAGNLSAHTIADDGVVTPSVLITKHTGEEWHGMVKLEGWEKVSNL